MITTVRKYRETINFISELTKRYDALSDYGRKVDTNLGPQIQRLSSDVKKFEELHPKQPGRTFELSNGKKMCNECCNGDRCDDSTHRLRADCWYCLGSAFNASC